MQTNPISKNAGQRDVLKEIEARLCGSVSAPDHPCTVCVRDINPEHECFLAQRC